MDFGDELEEYIILKLAFDEYNSKEYHLGNDFEIAGFEARDSVRSDEKKLLQLYFCNWKLPYYSKLKGWREKTPLYILHKGKLVSGLYVCSENEFDEYGWGQLHYFFTDPLYMGKKFHSILVKEAIEQSKHWGLKGVIINTDRYLLPDVYIKWGANEWKRLEKRKSSMPQPFIRKIYTHLMNFL